MKKLLKKENLFPAAATVVGVAGLALGATLFVKKRKKKKTEKKKELSLSPPKVQTLSDDEQRHRVLSDRAMWS